MKKAFTLVELMVVVVVIVILLSITLRLVGTGSDSTHRNVTIARLQRLENALSGYFAAFGSYPPVALHASRNVYADLDSDFNQKEGSETSSLVWDNVNAACRAQPVGARFPFRNDEKVRKYIELMSEIVVNRVNSDDPQWAEYKKYTRQLGGGFQPLNDPNQVGGRWGKAKTWGEVKVFKFGMMSYLLPRYMFMSRGIDSQDLEDCAQWNANNQLASHPNTGAAFDTWENQLKDARLVRRIPSQAVCARWMPNLEGIVSGNPIEKGDMMFFGIDVNAGGMSINPDNPGELARNVYLDQERTILDVMTVKDGWGNEFYYYSPPPFQSYQLWSAGSNGKTFPPWMPFSSLKSDGDKRTAANWMSDDIMYLNN